MGRIGFLIRVSRVVADRVSSSRAVRAAVGRDSGTILQTLGRRGGDGTDQGSDDDGETHLE